MSSACLTLSPADVTPLTLETSAIRPTRWVFVISTLLLGLCFLLTEHSRSVALHNDFSLSADDMQHVFQRFWRASERPGGCGLGLAIVQEIAHRHGGEATVQSLRPQGLRIELRLV